MRKSEGVSEDLKETEGDGRRSLGSIRRGRTGSKKVSSRQTADVVFGQSMNLKLSWTDSTSSRDRIFIFFVEDARYKLQELWDSLYFSEEEMLEFAPAFSDVYSDALLSAHEGEIARLEALKEQRAPTLSLVDKHRSLIKDRDDLAASSQDASRLLMKPVKGERRDPTRLLREEKMRKRIAKDLPKVEAELKKGLQRWEDDYGRPFLVHGVPYLDELAAAAEKSLPPRSKTPSAGPTYATTTKQIPLKAAPPPSSSRAGSVVGSVMRSNAPSRSGTATPATGTMKRNPMASSVSTTKRQDTLKDPCAGAFGDYATWSEFTGEASTSSGTIL